MFSYRQRSIPGTGRNRGGTSPGLPGDFPAWPRLPDQYPLRNRDTFQCRTWAASGRCHPRNLGKFS